MNTTNQKIALVTGAGSGIGEAATIQLYKSGYNVVLAGRRAHALERVIKGLPNQRNEALAVSTNVADPESVGKLFGKVWEKYNTKNKREQPQSNSKSKRMR